MQELYKISCMKILQNQDTLIEQLVCKLQKYFARNSKHNVNNSSLYDFYGYINRQLEGGQNPLQVPK